MKKEKFDKIVTLNPYSGENYRLQNSELQRIEKLSYDSSSYYISLLYPKDFITATIELSLNIDDADIADAIEIKAYEELGLDQSVEYKIEFVEEYTRADKDNRIFNVFVTEPETINELFSEIVDKTKFIDNIVPAPLLFRQIYKKEIIAESGVDCFLYFTKKDAFVVYYEDGRYLYSKSIKYSLEYIYEQYCSLIGERVDLSDFYQSLENEGVKSLDNAKQRNFMKIFGEVFMHLNDINIYFKRAFNVKQIDKLYIGSILGNIIGVEEYAKTYLGMMPNEFDFNYDINTESWFIDQMHYLMALHTLEEFENSDEHMDCNFTLFFRPPPFYLRKSGQFILTVSAAIVLAAALPLFHGGMSQYYDIMHGIKNDTRMQLQQEVNSIQKQIAQKTKEKERLLSLEQEAKDRFEQKTKSLETIASKKREYILKSDTLYMLAKDLNTKNISVSDIVSDKNTYVLTLQSKSDKKITEFIKYVTSNRKQVESISIERIALDEKSNMYTSDVEVRINE
ncbi:MAG: hypothetical protein ACQERK_01315 [Campylobacterota bacterium]